MNKELLILSALLHSNTFKQRTLPHIKAEYFEREETKTIFNVISSYEAEYKQVPNESAFEIELQNLSIPESIYQEVDKLRTKMFSEKVQDHIQKSSMDWLVDTTEKYCLQRSVFNAVSKSVEVISGEDEKTPQEALPALLRDALNVTFDRNIGHDYLEDYESRYEYYHLKENKIAFPLEVLNKTTKGGLTRKAVGIFVAPTGVGKTLALTMCASDYLKQGYNVLYVTLEMAEERIAERIDTALFDVTTDTLKELPKEYFEKKVQKIKAKTQGKLIIKEYPTGSMSGANLNALLDELETKKDFKPDIVLVDYIGLMKSTRISDATKSYNYLKAVTEELRAVAVDKEVLVLTAHQTNRAGQGASDFDLTEMADSAGISHTADWICGIISTEDLEKLGHVKFKQLKNRFGPLYPSTFIVGIDRSKMQLFDVDKYDDVVQRESGSSPSAGGSNTIEELSKKSTSQLRFD